MSKLEVGQIVYLKAVGNNARYDKEVRVEEFNITKVGRKYIEVNNEHRYKSIKFDMENEYREVTNYSSDWELYFSMQEILDEVESNKLTTEIKRVFLSWEVNKMHTMYITLGI